LRPLQVAFHFAPGIAAIYLLVATGMAQAGPDAQIIEYGKYVVRREMGTVDPTLDAKTLSPILISQAPKFIEHTDRIKATLCQRFGILFVVQSNGPRDATQITIRVTHPLLVRPDGVSGKVETWRLPTNTGPSLAGFVFKEPWEIVAGTWTFSVLFEDQVLAEQRFDVFAKAPQTHGLAEECGEPVS
jgi:hypothetical protein